MSNAIINAGKTLSLAEKRLICFCVRKLPSDFSPKVQIMAAEYMDAYSTENPAAAFNELVDASNTLFKRYISTRKEGLLFFRWISALHQSRFDLSITLTFSDEITPSLPMIRDHFTDYILFDTPHLQSIYSWRLLEIYKHAQANQTNTASFTTKDFCDYMEVPKSYRYDFHNLKQRVIEPAVEELNEKHHILIKWDTDNAPLVKKVANIYFYFEPVSGQIVDKNT